MFLLIQVNPIRPWFAAFSAGALLGGLVAMILV